MRRLLILMPILAIFFSACNALDTHPLSSVSPENYFQTESDLQMFSNSFYSSLLSCDFDEQSDVFVKSILDDEVLGGSNRIVPTTASDGSWTFTTLRKINTMLGYIDQCDDEAAVAKYTGLCRFFRARFYFNKVAMFGDVPWYDKELFSDDTEELFKPRDSREYVMSNMVEDIDFAIENLGENSNCYRVGKWAALAFKSRFCLFEGTFRKYHGLQESDWEHDYTFYLQQAADAAYELITTGPYKLYTYDDNPYESYVRLFAEQDANPDEFILAICYSDPLALRHNASGMTFSSSEKIPGYTRKFINTFLMADGSRFTDKTNWAEMTFPEETVDRDPRLAQIIRTPGYHLLNQDQLRAPDFNSCNTGYHPIKFVEDPGEVGENNVMKSGYATNDLPYLRLAEVMLNYAEAKAELGTLTQDDLDISINKIRDRALMPHLSMADANANPDWFLMSNEYGYPNVTGSNQGVILEIRRERTIELVEEGFRWNDLMRWKCGPCIDQDIYGMYIPGEGDYDFDGDGETDTVFYVNTNTSTATSAAAYKINSDVNLTGDTSGYVFYHKNITRYPFDEDRDYLYPIPIEERVLNPNLTQNPGWNDGLDF